MTIVYIAEIVGKTGIQCVKQLLPQLKKIYNPDVVIANADGVTNGSGIGRNHAGYVRKLGVSLITGGDFIYYKKDIIEALPNISYVVRPCNLPKQSPGHKFKIIQVPSVDGNSNRKVAIVSFLGQAGFNRIHSDNPFVSFSAITEILRRETPFIIVDYHGAMTAEKQAFGYFADGTASAVFGSHGRVQTADECILPLGTAYITDAGRTGSTHSVGGRHAQSRITEYITGIPDWSREPEVGGVSRPQLQGAVCVLDTNGKASSIVRLQIPMDCS